jgi:hypothetical protein
VIGRISATDLPTRGTERGTIEMTSSIAPAPKSETRSNPLGWLLPFLLAIVALTILCSHAPSRIRLIGLFSIAFGLIGGYISRFLASATGFQHRRIIDAVTFAAIVAGLVAVSIRSHQLQIAAWNRDPQTALATAILSSGKSPENPEARAKLEEMKAALARSENFTAYLGRRVSALGTWKSPWIELFWGAEILVAATVGAFCSIAARFRSDFRLTTESDRGAPGSG